MSDTDRQPSPVPNDSQPLWGMVIKDMVDRHLSGVAEYGTPLQAHNGRCALVDAYQEGLDQLVYLKQHIIEARQDALVLEEISNALAKTESPTLEYRCIMSDQIREIVKRWQRVGG